MKEALQLPLLAFILLCASESLMSSAGRAQMGSSTTSIGTTRVHIHQDSNGIPKITAKAVEGIQRQTVTTGGGFVNQSTLSLPLAPALDSRNKLHDVVKHPYETLPSLQNTRLDLVQ